MPFNLSPPVLAVGTPWPCVDWLCGGVGDEVIDEIEVEIVVESGESSSQRKKKRLSIASANLRIDI